MKIWNKAKQKQKRRRDAMAEGVHESPNMDRLVQIGEHIHVYDLKGNNTTALGYAYYEGVYPSKLVIALKGPPKPNLNTVFLYAQQYGLSLASVNDIHVLGNTSGLHSEMAIIQYLTGGNKAHPLMHQNEWLIEIACIGKGVCPDCSGFMARHGIPHTASRDNVAQQWTNPFTGANYAASGDNLQYQKKGKTFTSILPGGEHEKGWANK